MNTLYTIIGYTDPGNNQFVFQNVTKTAQMFMRKLLSHTVDNNRTRVYNFSPDGEMADIVCSYAQADDNPLETGTNLDLDAQSERIVKRLLEAENIANRQLGATGTKVKTGSIVLSLIEDDEGELRFVFAKVDHTKYLEGKNLELQVGFSIEDQDIWKTAVVQISKQPISTRDVLVYMDRPARYWTDGFLGLIAKRTDALNTTSMYKSVSGTIKREVEKISVNDYLILWSTLVHKMNAGTDFDYNVFIDELIDNYTPQSDKLGELLGELKTKLLNLPDKIGFDRQFRLDPKDVASLAKAQTLKIAPGIELKVNSEVDIKQAIGTDTDENGNKYIRIKCTDKKTIDELS